ncbi:hypothetical protein DSL64_11990 [Dyadobacter luteus]|uniref:Uncharacterized protein n=1 Tax=Dyadobacter luteus TaxID=2259619 RepID=A0A3D8YBW4_9BACT|nr:hypothetical protein [Dyadobacter luteus]REA61675.1 hypothetical protein DSL64_11990 [Dyadobacter luteus]
MNSEIPPLSTHLNNGLTETELAFIEVHQHDDITQLLLSAARFKNVDVKKLAGQIHARQKATKKLPEWVAEPKIWFPPALSVEQSSSEATARFKASLVSGKSLIDTTGGMGIDVFYMSRKFESAMYFELQKEVADAAVFNFGLFNCKNITVRNTDSVGAIASEKLKADWIFSDPARRDSNKDKVVKLSDCAPDIPAHLDLLLEAAPDILIKTSPLLDIDLAVKELKYVKAVYIIGYDQECKELLFHLRREAVEVDFELKPRVLNHNGDVTSSLDFTKSEEQNALVTYSNPLGYLYEPHAAVLKSGAFKTVATKLEAYKLAPSSHLYTSENSIEHFPGRTFEVIGYCKPDGGDIRKLIGQDKANLTIRNFPAKIQDLRKKWRLNEGGDIYLFATTLSDNKKVVVACRKPATL